MRGIFERPANSGIWWISYFIEGKHRREKLGTKQAAINAYRSRKAAILEGRKIPITRKTAAVLMTDLIDDALEFVADHKDVRSYICKAEIVRKDLGASVAADMTPQDIDRWIRKRCKTDATANRYKAFFSLCFREGVRNGKVIDNPARNVRHRKEGEGRLRFLSHDEYKRLRDVIKTRFPEHLADFIVSVNTGMRLTEQYTATWSQLDIASKSIRLLKTKSGTARTIHLSPAAADVIETLRKPTQKGSDPIFPRQGEKARFDTRSWFVPCLKDAEITGYVWHSNRHTYCSHLAMSGATIKEIQELAGHKTIGMSARYAHLSPEHRLAVVSRLAIGS